MYEKLPVLIFLRYVVKRRIWYKTLMHNIIFESNELRCEFDCQQMFEFEFDLI